MGLLLLLLAFGFSTVPALAGSDQLPHPSTLFPRNDPDLADAAAVSAAFCCTQVTSALPGQVSFANDTVYKNEQTGLPVAGYWSLQASSLKPACRVTPGNASNVATAVKILAQNNCLFAVRSGGHTAFPGAANIGRHGVTIDLSRLNQVIVAPDRKSVVVGPGARWGDVYLQLQSLGLAIAGGRVDDVGVGGLTLGGGKSFFGAKYGFVADAVTAFELVTGQGEILNVDAQTYPLLFRYLKGASNNLGIVTAFRFPAWEQGKLWGGFYITQENSWPKQFAALEAFINATSTPANPDVEAEIIMAYVWESVQPGLYTVFANFLSYTTPFRPLGAVPPVFQNFVRPDISPIAKTFRNDFLANFSSELNQRTPSGFRYWFGTATIGNDQHLFSEIKNISDSLFSNFSRGDEVVPGMIATFVFQPLTKNMLDNGCQKNALNLCASDGNLVLLDMTLKWKNVADDVRMGNAGTAFIDQSIAAAKRRGKYNPYLYLNYAYLTQDPISSYGADSVRNLRALSLRYDPKQVFQKLVPGGFKIPK